MRVYAYSVAALLAILAWNRAVDAKRPCSGTVQYNGREKTDALGACK